ncbi:MAG: M15 family metallopeptidase [Gammaproteobacteria bacterium]|nr:M15 family metallopeptidase [Gammaproteobacteria bacterium]
MSMLTPEQLLGQAESHLVALPEHPARDAQGLPFRVHADTREALLALCSAAEGEGFQPRLVSAFRSFEHQAAIWRAKAEGKRKLFALDGSVLDFSSLSPDELLHAILRWSALPGASRHHWGSEVDIIDRSRIPADFRVQLVPEEFSPGGPFHDFGLWLRDNLQRFGFFLPYAEYRGGVAAEPWHISHAPVSIPAAQALTPALLASAVLNLELPLRELVLAQLPHIESRYIRNICPPSAAGHNPSE